MNNPDPIFRPDVLQWHPPRVTWLDRLFHRFGLHQSDRFYDMMAGRWFWLCRICAARFDAAPPKKERRKHRERL